MYVFSSSFFLRSEKTFKGELFDFLSHVDVPYLNQNNENLIERVPTELP